MTQLRHQRAISVCCAATPLRGEYIAVLDRPGEYMRRRELITLLGGAVATWPLAARSQTDKVWHVGMLDTAPANLNAVNIDAFRDALSRLGYVEGRNLAIEYRSAQGHIERFPKLAAELIELKVDILVTRGTPATIAAKNATSTIPIVMAAIGEPLETGAVASLARPGGHVTGLSAFVTELTAKRIEIMHDLIPGMSRIALLDNMDNGSVPPQWNELKRAALSFGMQPLLCDVKRPEDIETAFKKAGDEHADALSVGNDSVVIASRHKIAELAMKDRLPAIYASREFVEAGGLISYAANYTDLYRRAAIYVDKIFKGADPGELPVEQPTTFELVINLKVARALGLSVPPALLSRADQVIE
jgi:putative tryptophan/tyrosine transport system substrate-binding protein